MPVPSFEILYREAGTRAYRLGFPNGIPLDAENLVTREVTLVLEQLCTNRHMRPMVFDFRSETTNAISFRVTLPVGRRFDEEEWKNIDKAVGRRCSGIFEG